MKSVEEFFGDQSIKEVLIGLNETVLAHQNPKLSLIGYVFIGDTIQKVNEGLIDFDKWKYNSGKKDLQKSGLWDERYEKYFEQASKGELNIAEVMSLK